MNAEPTADGLREALHASGAGRLDRAGPPLAFHGSTIRFYDPTEEMHATRVQRGLMPARG